MEFQSSRLKLRMLSLCWCCEKRGWAKTLEWKKFQKHRTMSGQGKMQMDQASAVFTKVFPIDMPDNGRGARILG